MARSTVEIGPYPVLVLDNFYRDPDLVRRLALRHRFASPRARFPGHEASCSRDSSYIPQIVGEQFATPLACDDDFRNRVVFSMIKETSSSSLRTQGPHVDWGRELAILIYLNPAPQCRGGTSFYRHRATSLVGTPARLGRRLARLMKRERLATTTELLQWILADPPVDRRAGFHLEPSPETWQLVHTIEMKTNRLVAFPSMLFHSARIATDMFARTKDGRRLTQTCFVHQVAA